MQSFVDVDPMCLRAAAEALEKQAYNDQHEQEERLRAAQEGFVQKIASSAAFQMPDGDNGPFTQRQPSSPFPFMPGPMPQGMPGGMLFHLPPANVNRHLSPEALMASAASLRQLAIAIEEHKAKHIDSTLG